MIARRLPALVALALLGLGACTSEPGPRTVARDVVETLDVSPEVKACMDEKLVGYDDDALKAIGDQAENADFSSADPNDESISEELRDFIDDLRSCVDGTATAATATSESSAPTTTD